MKSFKRYLQEKAAGNNASFAASGSSPSTKFSGVMGFGAISGDNPAANKPGKGDGKDINPEITAAINDGVKRNSIVKDKETGALQFRGPDGDLYTSFHAAAESSFPLFSEIGKKLNSKTPMITSEKIIAALKLGKVKLVFDEKGDVKSSIVNPGRPNERSYPSDPPTDEDGNPLEPLVKPIDDGHDGWLPDWFNDPSDDIAPAKGDPSIRPYDFDDDTWSPLDGLFDTFDGESGWRRRLLEHWDDRYDILKPYEWKKWQRHYGTPPPLPPAEGPPEPGDNPWVEYPPGSGQYWHYQDSPPIGAPYFGPNEQNPGWHPTFPGDHPNSPYYVPPVDGGGDGGDGDGPPKP